MKLPKRLAVKLSHCKRCGGGFLTTHLVTGRGKTLKVTQIEKVNLPDGFLVRAAM